MSKFKVGDEVVVLATDYQSIPVGTRTRIVNIDEYGADLWHVENPEGLYFFFCEFEPAPTHATALTIQAGKFYKTRDGRKVGPMRERYDCADFIVKVGDGEAYVLVFEPAKGSTIRQFIDAQTMLPVRFSLTVKARSGRSRRMGCDAWLSRPTPPTPSRPPTWSGGRRMISDAWTF